jgi:hypothetical protein
MGTEIGVTEVDEVNEFSPWSTQESPDNSVCFSTRGHNPTGGQLMGTSTTLSYDRVRRRVARHFKNAEAMQAFFATVYGRPPLQSARPADRDRWRRIEECPAVVVMADIVTMRNFLVDIGTAARTGDGLVTFQMNFDDAWGVRHALEALIKIKGTAEGPAILASLLQLLPRELKPQMLARRLRQLLEGTDAHALRREFESFLNAHHSN